MMAPHNIILFSFIVSLWCLCKVCAGNITADEGNEFDGNRFDRRVYLEDVFYSLRNQEWSHEEQPCLNQTLDLLINLQNFTLWATTMWDATASEPKGFLSGSNHQFGIYDECLRPGWSSEKYATLKTQYCLANVKLIHNNINKRRNVFKDDFQPYDSAIEKIKWSGDVHHVRSDELTWGVCVPASCSPRAVKTLLTAIILRSNLALTDLKYDITVDDQTCQVDRSQDPLSAGGVAFLSICGAVFVVVAICTTYHWYNERYFPLKEPNKWLTSLSLIRNGLNLVKCNESGLNSLYGVRFLSICFIVLSHRFGIFLGGPVLNGQDVDKVYSEKRAIWISHADLLVDSFFLLSGSLAIFNFVTYGKPINIFLALIKRYLRLAPALGMVIFFTTSMLWWTGDGPLWNRIVGGEVAACQQNYYTNIFMLNNYVNTENICLVITWYIPADFHFFMVSVILYAFYVRNKKWAIATFIALSCASIIVPGAITYYNKYPALLLFLRDFTLNPRGSEAFHNIYIKSHMRAGAYFVGVALGYVFAKIYPISSTKKLNLKWSCLCGFGGLLLMFASQFSAITFYQSVNVYRAEESALYAALDRPVWATGLALLVAATTYGYIPVISGFLCWSVWIPLSKLAYGIYLVHTLFIIRDVSSSRLPQHFDPFKLVMMAFGDVAVSSLLALVLLLFIEAPIQNIFNLLIAPNRQKGNVTIEENAVPSGSSNQNQTRERYFSNTSLPSVVIQSEKKQ